MVEEHGDGPVHRRRVEAGEHRLGYLLLLVAIVVAVVVLAVWTLVSVQSLAP